MRGVEQNAYKHLDQKTQPKGWISNPTIELNMEDLAIMVHNTNHGMHRFISSYIDLCRNDDTKKLNEFEQALLDAIEKKY